MSTYSDSLLFAPVRGTKQLEARISNTEKMPVQREVMILITGMILSRQNVQSLQVRADLTGLWERGEGQFESGKGKFWCLEDTKSHCK